MTDLFDGAAEPPARPAEPPPVAPFLVPQPPERPDAAPLRAAFPEIAAIIASPAADAFVGRRVEQLVRHGHGPAGDAARALHELPGKARDYVAAAVDHVRFDQGEPIAGRNAQRAIALRQIETAGALLLAAHDRIRAAIEAASRSAASGREGEAAA
ncbi:MAG TPA: hypothetical protein VGW34_03245 [Allosphingosinicella sp.]|nr:hypothetical protein [Allosphingosinicella sp.]